MDCYWSTVFTSELSPKHSQLELASWVVLQRICMHRTLRNHIFKGSVFK